jgi:nucleotide-binding universal stress UspA family protein
MCRYILIPATGTGTDAPVFATALAVARVLPTHLEFLHVRVDVHSTLALMASADVVGGAGYGEMVESLEREVASRQKQAELAFRDLCERERLPVTADPTADLPSAEWRMETGDELAWLAEHGRAADLLVIGRAREGEDVAMDLLEAALMGTGRPVLIAPPKAPNRLFGTVAIAWKSQPEAARAVGAAAPFLQIADQVVIISVSEDARTDAHACERLRHALAWHNPRTSVRCLPQDGHPPVESLLSAVAAVNADTLIMGGYGHSRLREVVFGGFTRHMLSCADLPVLMAH